MRSALYKNKKATNVDSDFSFFQRKEASHFFNDASTSFFKPNNQKSSDDIQLKPNDKHDLTSTQLSGNHILESTFDNEAIVAKFSRSKGGHVKRLQEALLQLNIDLPEHGADADYGTETEDGIKEFQEKSGMSEVEWDGIVGRKTIALLDRSLRNDAISTDTDNANEDFTSEEKEDDTCDGKPIEDTCPEPNTDVINGATEAVQLIDKVLKEQLPPVKNEAADYPAIFDTIFRHKDTGDVAAKVVEIRAIYEQVKDYINSLKTKKNLSRCPDKCDGGCKSGTPAYQTTKENGDEIISFCPDFKKNKESIFIVIHESHHASIKGSTDKAYPDTRLFDKLEHQKALINAASFHVYAAWVDSPGSQPIGQKVKDTNLISDNDKKGNVDMSLAHLNQWLRLVPFDVSKTLQGAEEANKNGKYIQQNAKLFMDLVFSKWFGLTKPPTPPNAEDIQKLRAIDERVDLMREAFKSPFTITETINDSLWSRGPGSSIALNNKVLNLETNHMITALLQELVHATPKISAETEALYVGTINDIRNLRKVDPR